MEDMENDKGLVFPTGKASMESMNNLHGLVAYVLEKMIKDALRADSDTEVDVGKLVDKAIKFLKDNNITSDIATSEEFESLASTLQKAMREDAPKLTVEDMMKRRH